MSDISNSRLNKINYVIDLFDSQRTQRYELRTKMITDFIQTYSYFTQTHNASNDFNVLKSLKINNDEVRHSAILAWLLNSRINYYENNLLFDMFLECCHIKLSSENTTGYQIRTEFAGSESIVDMLIYKKNNFIIYLENKVNAPEGFDQCNREWRDMRKLGERLTVPRNKQFAVFLTPFGRKPEKENDDHWITLSYVSVGNNFRQLIPKIKSAKTRYLLEDWLEIISQF